MIGIRMPQILPLSSSSSAGMIRAARRGSANFITTVSQVMLLRISIRKEDLKPMASSSPL